MTKRRRNRLIFFVGSPFTRRDYDRYGMAIFAANGINVDVWDLTQALHPTVAALPALGESYVWDRVSRIGSLAEASARLDERADETIVFAAVALGFRTLPLFRRLAGLRIPYAVGPVSVIPVPTPTWRQRFAPRQLLSKLARSVPLAWIGVSPAAIVLAEARRASIRRPEVTRRTRVVATHSLDYNTFLSQADTPNQRDTVVYVDNYLASHPDFLFLGEAPPVTASRFYPALCRFLDAVEARLGLRTVIAAHPRSEYASNEMFGGREIVKGKTPDLIARARLVIMNHSTAVSFAVLHRKPLAFITSDEFSKNSLAPYLADVARLLSAPVYNIDSFGSLESLALIGVDAARYEGYEKDYISMPGAPALPSWQIFCDAIAKL